VKNILFALVCILTLTTRLSAADVQVRFSPRGGCTDAIVGTISHAKQSILVQAYTFTSKPIAQALVDAHKRGVKVSVILDSSQRTDQYSSATFLSRAGIATAIDAEHNIAHDKIMVIDGVQIITGSFNFTKAAEESNAENLLIITDKKIAEAYIDNWYRHARHSKKYAEPRRKWKLF